ncbi:MAG TPA: hypothetical protein VES01_03810 [Dermatophilaceae bacterium]|nr:hypothetical protein [Dermatophilaceae bacterium]
MGAQRASGFAERQSGTSAATLLARWVAEILAPPVLAAATLFFVALRSTAPIWVALGWGLLTSLFSAVLPYAVVLVGVRRGHFGDRELRQRHERLVPLLLGVVSVLVGMGIVRALGAPLPILATVAGMLAGLVVVILITTVWKVSLHLAVASGAVVVLWLQLGTVAMAAVPLLVLLAWSRVRTGSHTVAQAATGSLVGAAVVAVVYGGVMVAG